MLISLIVCTYQRAEPLLHLLNSVKRQTLHPNEIVIIDGSLDDATMLALEKNEFQNLHYFKVDKENRGLTKQRNYGISKVDASSEIVFFLDDDTVLEPEYFSEIMKGYDAHPDAVGIGGYISNEVKWDYAGANFMPKITDFFFDGWKRNESSRFILRKRIGLDSDAPPGFVPSFLHGRSVGFLPPSGKIYQTEQLMGGVSSFKKSIFSTLQFSTYFEGYGLYEDSDFTLRVSKLGKIYINTNAKLAHYHDASGRPNQFSYGKMVVRNGWYVWRVKNSKPDLQSRFKWHAITLLLTAIRFGNALKGTDKMKAFTEALGRTAGWWSLIFNPPKQK